MRIFFYLANKLKILLTVCINVCGKWQFCYFCALDNTQTQHTTGYDFLWRNIYIYMLSKKSSHMIQRTKLYMDEHPADPYMYVNIYVYISQDKQIVTRLGNIGWWALSLKDLSDDALSSLYAAIVLLSTDPLWWPQYRRAVCCWGFPFLLCQFPVSLLAFGVETDLFDDAY